MKKSKMSPERKIQIEADAHYITELECKKLKALYLINEIKGMLEKERTGYYASEQLEHVYKQLDCVHDYLMTNGAK